MEISGKKPIQAIIQDPALHKYIKVVYLFKTQEYLIHLCKKYKTNYQIKDKSFFDDNYSDKTKYKYKYAIAIIKQAHEITLKQLIEKNKNQGGVIVVLDHIHDPFNLGAILRSCAAAGVIGVVMPKKKQAPVNHNSVLKASQGYSLKIDIVTVANLHAAIMSLKKNGYWIYTSDLNKKAKCFREVQYNSKSVLVLGNEGDGVSTIIKNSSDFLIYIPMKPGVDSLNVSVAAGIMLFEITKSI